MLRIVAHRGAVLGCVCALASQLALGCGAQAPPNSKTEMPPQPAVPVVANAAKPAPQGVAAQLEIAQVETAQERKIIFNGTLDVEVKDFSTAYTETTKQLQDAKAYFTKTEISGSSGTRRYGTMTIKVPVQRFQSLMQSLATLGNPVRNMTDSQDVTDEYIDVEARVKNLKVEEEAFNKLLKEAGSRLEDVFRIREQIKLNREQIERAESRLLTLGKLTSLSTIVLTLREREEYIAPTAAKVKELPSFSDRASGTFANSWGAVVGVAEAIVLVIVAVAPWIPLVGVIAIVSGLLLRRGSRALGQSAA